MAGRVMEIQTQLLYWQPLVIPGFEIFYCACSSIIHKGTQKI